MPEDATRRVETINGGLSARYREFTPSVMTLLELGLPAPRAVLDLLDASDLMTGTRAERVLESVIMRRHGWMRGKGYLNDRDGQKLTKDLLAANGDYNADGSSEVREAAIEKWRDWLERQQGRKTICSSASRVA